MLMLGIDISMVALALAGAGEPRVSEEQARILFADYQEKGRTFDPGEADLHCENGNILMYREDASGAVKKIEGAAAGYKRILRESVSEAKLAGDYSEYSGVTYHSVGANVRIDATRYSVLRKYKSPASFLVGMCDAGGIGILEMTIYSKPPQE